jgi:hypothetical protein
MCSAIKTLHNFRPPTTEDEISNINERQASLFFYSVVNLEPYYCYFDGYYITICDLGSN